MNMKKNLLVIGFILISWLSAMAQQVKTVSDCTVLFEVSIEDEKADPQMTKAMAGSTKILYLKGAKSRIDLLTPGFKQTTFYDLKSDSTIILRELGNAKYITYLSEAKRQEKNKKYIGITFANTSEKKTILGYECVKVIATLTNGATFNVYYTPSIVPANNEYEFQFKGLPGFVMEYEEESETQKTKIKYAATKITLSPVPAAKFDVPKSGYRVL